MSKKAAIYIIITLIVGLALFNSLLSSPHPDGLERVAEDHGFISQARDSLSFFSDYQLPLGNSLLGTGLAGLLGVLLVYLLITGLGKLLAREKER